MPLENLFPDSKDFQDAMYTIKNEIWPRIEESPNTDAKICICFFLSAIALMESGAARPEDLHQAINNVRPKATLPHLTVRTGTRDEVRESLRQMMSTQR